MFEKRCGDMTPEEIVNKVVADLSTQMAQMEDKRLKELFPEIEAVRRNSEAIATEYFQNVVNSGIPITSGAVYTNNSTITLRYTFTPPRIAEQIEIPRETLVSITNSSDRPNCLYHSGSHYLKCAVNPSEPCEGCQHYEPKHDAPAP